MGKIFYFDCPWKLYIPIHLFDWQPIIYLSLPPHQTNILELEIFTGETQVWVKYDLKLGKVKSQGNPHHKPHLGYSVNILTELPFIWHFFWVSHHLNIWAILTCFTFTHNSISQLVTGFLLQMGKLRHREVKCLLKVTVRVWRSKNLNLICFGDHPLYHYIALPWFLNSYFPYITFVFFPLYQKPNPRHLQA